MLRSSFRTRPVHWLESRPLVYMAALVALTDRFPSQNSIVGETKVYRQLLVSAGSETERRCLSQSASRNSAEALAVQGIFFTARKPVRMSV